MILTPCLWRLMLNLSHIWNMCSFENPNWPEVPPPLSVLLLLWKSRKVQMLVIDYESYVPVSNEHSKQFSLSEKTIRQLKKGKQYFLGFPGFPLYYLLFAPLWDQLKPYSLKKPFMANYLFWQSSMAFSLSIFFILLSKIPFHQIENGISLDTPLSENWSKFGKNQLKTKGASTWVTLI